MPHSLELTLFGSPTVRCNGSVVTGFRTGKAQALLYYLAVTGRPHTRSTLAGLFWGDQPEAAARASDREVIGFGGTSGYDSTLNGKVLDLAMREAVDNLAAGRDAGQWGK